VKRSPEISREPIVGSWKFIALARAALAMAMLAFALTYPMGRGRENPRFLFIGAVAAVVVMLFVSVEQLRGRLLNVPRLVVALDVASVVLFLICHSLDSSRYLFPLTFAPIVEAALVFGFAGALFAWASTSLGHLAREALAASLLDTAVDPGPQVVRVATGLVTALALGALATAAEERRVSERLRALDDMKNTFLHAVSHELRTPLASVKGFADILRRHGRDFPPEKVHEIAQSISINADKLQRLLADLLDLDRLTRNVLQPTLLLTDVGALVLNVVEQADVTQQVVRVEAPSVRAYVDGPKLERIVENLVVNAAKHTPPHTHIHVSLRPTPGGLLLTVDDEGPGIPDDLKESIFEPFQQAPGDDNLRPPGTGIGLSLVARFAALHGGRAWVEDRAGGGASFRVFIPTVVESQVESPVRSASPESGSTGARV
jgi:signal transduction histidine kinase